MKHTISDAQKYSSLLNIREVVPIDKKNIFLFEILKKFV